MINKIRFVVFSFALTAFSGLSAQNDTTLLPMAIPSFNINIRRIREPWYMMEKYISTPDTMNVRPQGTLSAE